MCVCVKVIKQALEKVSLNKQEEKVLQTGLRQEKKDWNPSFHTVKPRKKEERCSVQASKTQRAMAATSSVRWVLDHEINNCSQCHDEFSLIRRKHHCRVCGKLFCAECSAFKLLIPTTKLIQHPNGTDDNRAPLRTCSHCARSLHHVQEDLRKLLAKAHAETIVERLSPERYLNRPFSSSLQSEIKKATHTLWNFTSDNIVEGRDRIPKELLMGAKGLAFLTVAKAGFCFTGRLGTGLVIARLADGTWSAPSAIMMSGMGTMYPLYSPSKKPSLFTFSEHPLTHPLCNLV